MPAGTGFATKGELARQMVVRALDAGADARWVAGDEVYGNAPGLRAALEERGVGIRAERGASTSWPPRSRLRRGSASPSGPT